MADAGIRPLKLLNWIKSMKITKQKIVKLKTY
jgi:hypothetical protein